MKWLENLNSPYYHEVKFSKKYARFYSYLEVHTALWSRGKMFTKIKQFCWSDLKPLTVPVITSSNFVKNKAVLLKWLENLNCP